MIKSLIMILALAASTFAAAIPDTSIAYNNATLSKRGKKGICDRHDRPTEEDYNKGVEVFCRKFPHVVSHKVTVTFTIQTTSYEDKSPLKWVWSMRVDKNIPGDNEGPRADISREFCERKMKEILSEGELGKAYCVVENTEDVLFMGRKFEEKYDFPPSIEVNNRKDLDDGSSRARIVFESKRGDPKKELSVPISLHE